MNKKQVKNVKVKKAEPVTLVEEPKVLKETTELKMADTKEPENNNQNGSQIESMSKDQIIELCNTDEDCEKMFNSLNALYLKYTSEMDDIIAKFDEKRVDVVDKLKTVQDIYKKLVGHVDKVDKEALKQTIDEATNEVIKEVIKEVIVDEVKPVDNVKTEPVGENEAKPPSKKVVKKVVKKTVKKVEK